MFGTGEIFILFFVTLGPFKLLGPCPRRNRYPPLPWRPRCGSSFRWS